MSKLWKVVSAMALSLSATTVSHANAPPAWEKAAAGAWLGMAKDDVLKNKRCQAVTSTTIDCKNDAGVLVRMYVTSATARVFMIQINVHAASAQAAEAQLRRLLDRSSWEPRKCNMVVNSFALKSKQCWPIAENPSDLERYGVRRAFVVEDLFKQGWSIGVSDEDMLFHDDGDDDATKWISQMFALSTKQLAGATPEVADTGGSNASQINGPEVRRDHGPGSSLAEQIKASLQERRAETMRGIVPCNSVWRIDDVQIVDRFEDGKIMKVEASITLTAIRSLPFMDLVQVEGYCYRFLFGENHTYGWRAGETRTAKKAFTLKKWDSGWRLE